MQDFLLIILITPHTSLSLSPNANTVTERNIKVLRAPFGGSPVPGAVPGKEGMEWASINTMQPAQMPVTSSTHPHASIGSAIDHTYVKTVQGPCHTSSAETQVDVQLQGISRCAEFWRAELENHPDKEFVKKICSYVVNGVPIEFQGNARETEIKNWPSACKYEKEVNQFIEKHIEGGAIEGPFNFGEDVVQTSPLRAFIKKVKKK